MRISSTFFTFRWTAKSPPPKKLFYNFNNNETKDPLGGRKFMYEAKSA